MNYHDPAEWRCLYFLEENLSQKGGFTSDMAIYVSLNCESMASGAANMTTREFAIGSYLMGQPDVSGALPLRV